jgi:hypothetical protein
MGLDVVTNNGVAKDVMQFSSTLFANFAAAMASAGQVGANTLFEIDAADMVTLDNVTRTSLRASNFISSEAALGHISPMAGLRFGRVWRTFVFRSLIPPSAAHPGDGHRVWSDRISAAGLPCEGRRRPLALPIRVFRILGLGAAEHHRRPCENPKDASIEHDRSPRVFANAIRGQDPINQVSIQEVGRPTYERRKSRA